MRRLWLLGVFLGIGLAQSFPFLTDLGGPRPNRALVFGQADYGVVLVHGRAYNSESWSKFGQVLSQAGFTAIAPEYTTPLDLENAREFMKDRGASKVALIAASAGAQDAVRAVNRSPGDWDYLILLSPVRIESAPLIPTLVIASQDEPLAGVARGIAEGTGELVLLPGNAHAQAILAGPEGARLEALLLETLTARSQSAR